MAQPYPLRTKNSAPHKMERDEDGNIIYPELPDGTRGDVYSFDPQKDGEAPPKAYFDEPKNDNDDEIIRNAILAGAVFSAAEARTRMARGEDLAATSEKMKTEGPKGPEAAAQARASAMAERQERIEHIEQVMTPEGPKERVVNADGEVVNETSMGIEDASADLQSGAYANVVEPTFGHETEAVYPMVIGSGPALHTGFEGPDAADVHDQIADVAQGIASRAAGAAAGADAKAASGLATADKARAAGQSPAAAERAAGAAQYAATQARGAAATAKEIEVGQRFRQREDVAMEAQNEAAEQAETQEANMRAGVVAGSTLEAAPAAGAAAVASDTHQDPGFDEARLEQAEGAEALAEEQEGGSEGEGEQGTGSGTFNDVAGPNPEARMAETGELAVAGAQADAQAGNAISNLPPEVGIAGGNGDATSYTFVTPPEAQALGYDAVIPLGTHDGTNGGAIAEQAWQISSEIAAAVAQAKENTIAETYGMGPPVEVDDSTAIPADAAQVLDTAPATAEQANRDMQRWEAEAYNLARDQDAHAFNSMEAHSAPSMEPPADAEPGMPAQPSTEGDYPMGGARAHAEFGNEQAADRAQSSMEPGVTEDSPPVVNLDHAFNQDSGAMQAGQGEAEAAAPEQPREQAEQQDRGDQRAEPEQKDSVAPEVMAALTAEERADFEKRQADDAKREREQKPHDPDEQARIRAAKIQIEQVKNGDAPGPDALTL